MTLRAVPLSLVLALSFLGPAFGAVVAAGAGLPAEAVQSTIARLLARHGKAHEERIRLGVSQAAARWWPEDGDVEAFAAFCEQNFLAEPAEVAAAFRRLQEILEQVDGHLHEVRRFLTSPLELDTGPVSPLDRLLADLDLQAHVDEDLFRTRVAFLALLNFPVHTLADRLEKGSAWDRETWARSRMMDRFASRVPAAVAQRITRAFTAAGHYIDEYDIRLDRLVAPDGRSLFPEGKKAISHWGLRDELKLQYSQGPDGLERQRAIQRVMERIVRQEIPAAVRASTDLLWCPETNEVRWAPGARAEGPPPSGREPDTRYAVLLDIFHAVRAADPFVPTAPHFIRRRFELDRQIPEKEVEALLVSVLSSEEVRQVARLIEKRLGRPLEPFDIWYDGFSPRAGLDEADLDRTVRERYPTVGSFQAAIPDILQALGFSKDKAAWLADRIVVDAARGAGHALGAVRRGDKAHLRTRVPSGGMDYKGYNIAIHELGHNVEQVFSLNGTDHWFLAGVPNNAFTEALAFVFQARDLELLGLETRGEERRRLEALNDLWATFEIGGVALVDMGVWNWMYDHPDASPAELREATREIARRVWNAHFAPVFGQKDVEILAIYSHMISYGLYLPDYPLGHIAAFQLARHFRSADFGREFERIARQGRLTPEAWMRGAVGRPISAESLLAEAREALAQIVHEGQRHPRESGNPWHGSR